MCVSINPCNICNLLSPILIKNECFQIEGCYFRPHTRVIVLLTTSKLYLSDLSGILSIWSDIDLQSQVIDRVTK